jgi:hypothetical protein
MKMQGRYSDLEALRSIDDTAFSMSSALWNAAVCYESLGDEDHWAWDTVEIMEVDERFDAIIAEMITHTKSYEKHRKAFEKAVTQLVYAEEL